MIPEIEDATVYLLPADQAAARGRCAPTESSEDKAAARGGTVYAR